MSHAIVSHGVGLLVRNECCNYASTLDLL